jgi:hypothetical protein
MNEITFHETRTVQVTILGKSNGPRRARSDDGLVGRFLRWQMDNMVFPNCRGGLTGAGTYIGYFAPKDMPAIREFLSRDRTQQLDGKR